MSLARSSAAVAESPFVARIGKGPTIVPITTKSGNCDFDFVTKGQSVKHLDVFALISTYIPFPMAIILATAG